MWFVFSLLTMLLWGSADLFYKKGADENDRYSALKTSMMVGLVMGIHALYVLLFSGISYHFKNLLLYLPVSSMYILSMTVGYFGLRYLELSVASPVQNASGAVVCILCFLILHQAMDRLSLLAVIFICLGVFFLGVLEKQEEKTVSPVDKAFTHSFAAILIPVLYCIIDALGTFFDAYYLDDITTTPLTNITEETLETVANTSYELTFFLVAVILFVFLKAKHIAIRPKDQKDRLTAALFETAGQYCYVFAMSGNGIVAAPMVAAYCTVSILLSRIFLSEKLSKKQSVCIAFVIAGILLLGIVEGLAE